MAILNVTLQNSNRCTLTGLVATPYSWLFSRYLNSVNVSFSVFSRMVNLKSSCDPMLSSQIPYNIPYIGNHPQKKSCTNYLICHGSQENLRDLGNLMYKNSSQNKKRKKTFTNVSRFAKFVNFLFSSRFPIYGIV